MKITRSKRERKRTRGYRTAGWIGAAAWKLVRAGQGEQLVPAKVWSERLGITRREFFRAKRIVPWDKIGLVWVVVHKKGLILRRLLDHLFGVPPSRAYPYAPQKTYRKSSRIENKRPFDGQKTHLEMPKHIRRHWMGRLKRSIQDWSALQFFRDWGVDLYKCIGVIVWRWRWSEERLLNLERGIQRILCDFPNSIPAGLKRNRASSKARWGYAFKCLQIIAGLGI